MADTPSVMVWHVRHNRALHRKVLILRVATLPIPWSHESDLNEGHRIGAETLARRGTIRVMETANVPSLLKHAKSKGCTIDLDDVTYYVGHETVVHCDDSCVCRIGKKRCLKLWNAMQPT
jgi:KUP system potassium uptake protein